MITDSSQGNKLNGFYRGVVLKHLSNGFCKIYVPSVYPEEYNSYEQADNLPSAEQAAPLSFGTNNGLGIFSYPNIGSIVWCFFQNGDQNLPVYFASTLGGPNAVDGNWNKALTPASLDENTASVHKLHIKNSDIEIYEDGIIKVHTEANGKTCDINIDNAGNIDVKTSTTVNITTPDVLVDAGTSITMKAGSKIEMSAPEITSTGSSKITMTAPTTFIEGKSGGDVIIAETSLENHTHPYVDSGGWVGAGTTQPPVP